ncbi:MAG TPA: DUF2277 family protein, partial [Myxococcota bacterium]
TDDDIRAAALQFVRKIAGTTKPSRQNEAAFAAAVDAIYASSKQMLAELVTTTPPRSRVEFEAVQKMKFKKEDARRAARFAAEQQAPTER